MKKERKESRAKKVCVLVYAVALKRVSAGDSTFIHSMVVCSLLAGGKGVKGQKGMKGKAIT